MQKVYAAIISNPVDVTAELGEAVSFTVDAIGDGLTYRWQYKTPDSNYWENSPASGSKTATLSLTATAYRNNYQYRCVVTDQYGNEVCTAVATLTVIG